MDLESRYDQKDNIIWSEIALKKMKWKKPNDILKKIRGIESYDDKDTILKEIKEKRKEKRY